MGRTNRRRRSEPFLALVFAGPIDDVPGRQFHLSVDLLDRFLYRTPQIPASHAVLNGDVSRVSLTIDFRTSVRLAHLG